MTTDTLEKTESLRTGTDTLCYAGQWILKTDENSLDNIPDEFATPIHKIRTKTILNSARVAERAQRNFDFSKPVLEEDIQTITEACTTMPTKQQLPYYTLVASTDPAFNKACYDIAVDRTDDSPAGRNPDFDLEYHRNGQVWAPLLLIFLENNKEKVLENEDQLELHGDHDEERFAQMHMSIGIASGVAAFTASMLGYKTGFCACIEYQSLVGLLKTKNTIPEHALQTNGGALFLGIGHGTEHDRKSVVVNNKIVYTAETCDKQIDIIHI